MVSISRLVNGGLIASGQTVFQQLATPEQAAIEQYNIVRYLGGLGPYIQHPGLGISTDIPDQCSIEQIQLMSRHGERYPTTNAGKRYEAVMKKFDDYPHQFLGDLAFLNSYEFFVTNKEYYDQETSPYNSPSPFAGTSNALRHGAAFRARYNALYNESAVIPVFTSNNNRVMQTSQYFIRGFLGDQYESNKVNTVVLSEDPSMGANSLTPASACSAWNPDEHADIINNYTTKYLEDIRDRLTKDNEGLNLTASDVYEMFGWCAYEINVRGSSPVCDLFSQNDLVQYEYSVDLRQYYNDGPGNSVIKPIGSVLLRAVLKLLKDDANPNKVWLSFSHDTDWENFHGALGLFEPELPLPSDHIPFPNVYVHSTMVPQGARIYTEKLKCGDDSYVRFIVNDAVIPIKACSSGPGFSCKLDQFENYVNQRLEGVDYAKSCDIGNATDTLTFYWDYTTKYYNATLLTASY